MVFSTDECEKVKDMTDSVILKEAVHGLDHRKQAIVGLRAFGYTQQAVAELLEISRYTVWLDEKKALASLKGKV